MQKDIFKIIIQYFSCHHAVAYRYIKSFEIFIYFPY